MSKLPTPPWTPPLKVEHVCENLIELTDATGTVIAEIPADPDTDEFTDFHWECARALVAPWKK